PRTAAAASLSTPRASQPSAVPTATPTPSPTPTSTPTPPPATPTQAVRAKAPPPRPAAAPAHPPASAPPPPPTPPPGPPPITIDVPVYHQQYNLSCEESSLSMVLAFLGHPTTEQQVFDLIGIDTVHYWAGSAGGGDRCVGFVGDPTG